MNFAAQVNSNIFIAKLSGLAIISSLLLACGGGGSGATEPIAVLADSALTPIPAPM